MLRELGQGVVLAAPGSTWAGRTAGRRSGTGGTGGPTRLRFSGPQGRDLSVVDDGRPAGPDRSRGGAGRGALVLSATARDAAAEDDVEAQALWRAVRAPILARAGDVRAAEELAFAAVDFAARSEHRCCVPKRCASWPRCCGWRASSRQRASRSSRPLRCMGSRPTSCPPRAHRLARRVAGRLRA